MHLYTHPFCIKKIEEHLAHRTTYKKRDSEPAQVIKNVLSTLDCLHSTHQVAHITKNHLTAQTSSFPLLFYAPLPPRSIHPTSPLPIPSHTVLFYGFPIKSKCPLPSPPSSQYYQYVIVPSTSSQTCDILHARSCQGFPNGVDWWGGQFRQNGQKLHQNYKACIFGSKQ